ncbi:MAG: ABC transporter ATP-binding protein [Alphaproteobacteria bacterium]|nr:ABC transporter ATP-binding protein [Alphaproteobacteria bacterium]
MSDLIITVENLSKKYLVAHRSELQGRARYLALRDVIGREIRHLTRKMIDVARGRQLLLGDVVEDFWALKDINFEVKRGEALGIIGRNGAGKSTLLKILSRITEPTRGRVTLRGRVASLLEVGTGFHPELTGRQNIFLNGAILGMTSAEIKGKFDEIVAFAEVENFLDTPVKHFSSGMYVRLAFAVAAHLNPEILVVDEVMAVGDTEFQKKCLGKMNEVSRVEGRTVLLVSHNMVVMDQLCQTCIWLDQGSVRLSGRTSEVIRAYLSHGGASKERVVQLHQLPRKWANRDKIRLSSLEWLCKLPLRHGEPLRARILFESQAPAKNLAIGIGFSDLSGSRIVTYDTDLQDGYRPNIARPGVYAVDVEIDALPLQPDTYLLDIGCRSGDSQALDYIPSALQLEILAGPSTPGFIAARSTGVRLNSRWTWNLERLTGHSASGWPITAAA